MNIDTLRSNMDEISKEAREKYINEINSFIEANRETLFAPVFNRRHPDCLWKIFNVKEITFDEPNHIIVKKYNHDYAISIGSKCRYSKNFFSHDIFSTFCEKHDVDTLTRASKTLEHIVDLFAIIYRAGFRNMYVDKNGFLGSIYVDKNGFHFS
jgi:hypothetical protein